MLPLRTTYRNLFLCLLLPLIFTSCSDKSKTDLAIIKALDESIENSNKMLFMSSSGFLISLQSKMEDPATKERAMFWYPKAKKIQDLSKDAYDYIENLKPEVDKLSKKEIDKNLVKKVFEKLMKYQNDILLVDPEVAYQFQKSLKIFTKAIDSINSNQFFLLQNYFHDASKISDVAMLNKLQNNIRINEERILVFCHEQTGKVSLGPCVVDWPIIGLSSTIVQSGERIEITAGVGSFYSDMDPEVFIYGKRVALKDNALAMYKLKAETKPGKYYVPVKINYTDQDGRQQTVQKEIEYTVANIQQ